MRAARGIDNIGQGRTESVPAHFARLHRPLNRLRIVCGAFLYAAVEGSDIDETAYRGSERPLASSGYRDSAGRPAYGYCPAGPAAVLIILPLNANRQYYYV